MLFRSCFGQVRQSGLELFGTLVDFDLQLLLKVLLLIQQIAISSATAAWDASASMSGSASVSNGTT